MPDQPLDPSADGALSRFIQDRAIQELPCGFLVLDHEGRIAAINDTFLRVLGYARAEVVGPMHVEDLLEEPYRQGFRTHYQRFMETGHLINAPRIFLTKDGYTVPVLLNATAFRNPAGAFLHTICVLTFTAHLRLAMGSQPGPQITAQVDGDALRIRRSSPPVTALSQREREVLTRVASGWTSQDIARALGITLGTVEVHRRNIKTKLELHTTADLTRYAILAGLSLM